MTLSPWLLRAGFVAVGLGGWFWTQAWIARRPLPAGRIGDRLLDLTGSWNRRLRENPRRADGLLVATSALIDLLGIFVIALGVFGPSVRPLLGLALLFALRQTCQALCALPAPEGMIWRRPGFPSLLVTYGTSTDLFFSGHTAIAVYGSLELARSGGTAGVILGVAIVLVEAATVLVLRAHYTMDVYAGAVTALWVYGLAGTLAPGVDRWLALLGG